MRLELVCWIISSLSVLGLALCYRGPPVYESPHEWELWKSIHSKSYGSKLEELEKHIIWHSNKAYVDQHNINAELGVYSYHVKLNHLGDMTDRDYHEKYLSYKKTDWTQGKESGYVKFYTPPIVSSLPDSIDWRTKDAVSSVKYQGTCGASYAFAATGTLEGAFALTYDSYARQLSEQNLIDCSVPEGNNGCNGGNMYNSFMYIIFNDGIDTAQSYRYKGIVRHCSPWGPHQKTCNFTSQSVGASMSGIITITSGVESHLQAAVTFAGPVAAAVDAKSTAFRFYSSGVFSSSYCSSYDVNHAMLVIGYGTSTNRNGANVDYWVLKNSWGTDWGQEGYIWMTRNQYNQCGIATDCSYPSL